jgi:hypothetical protein
MGVHRCQCPHCAPGAFPPEVRSATCTGPGHFAVRFGRQDMFLTPYLDGEKIERVVEALAGPDGWVVVVAKPAHRCFGCHRDGCQEVRRGAVEVRGTLGPSGPSGRKGTRRERGQEET